jgi:3-hydroxyisobutyrate dehydrogenase
MRVGFVGLGNMGHPMAKRLIASGFSLVVYDVNRNATNDLVAHGAESAQSAAAVAERCDVLCTSLPGPAEVEATALGDDGILHGAKPGLIYIDFTTNSPILVRRLSRTLAAIGTEMLDAPLSGGIEGARTGKLTALVGGSAETVERARPVLEAVAATILHLGEIGIASTCKVLHNCAVFAANLATIECLSAGVKAGVDAKLLIDVFQKSGLGRNLDLQVAMPATLFRGHFEPRFALKTAFKDMGLAAELGRAYQVPMPLAERCQQDMAEAMKRGWGDRDNTIFLTLQEERAGVSVRTGE